MALSTMEALKQTSKAILFEEFDADEHADSLWELLSSFEDPTKAKFDSELAKLEVSSFAEFTHKFMPKIYECCMLVNGLPQIYYTLDRREAEKRGGTPQKIEENTFYRMLMKMYESKGVSGQSNLEFDDKAILEMLTPVQDIKDIKTTRQVLLKSMERYLEAKDKGENTDEYVEIINRCRDQIIDKYGNSKLALLPVAMMDCESKIKLLQDSLKALPAVSSGSQLLLLAGMLNFDSEGNLVVSPVSANEVRELPSSDNKQALLGRASERVKILIEGDYDDACNPQGEDEAEDDGCIVVNNEDEDNETKNDDFTKAIILGTYAPDCYREQQEYTREEAEEKISALMVKKEAYEKVYVQAKDAFIRALVDVCEKMLSVKVFFDHATANGKLPENAKLIVANCKLGRLLDSCYYYPILSANCQNIMSAGARCPCPQVKIFSTNSACLFCPKRRSSHSCVAPPFGT